MPSPTSASQSLAGPELHASPAAPNPTGTAPEEPAAPSGPASTVRAFYFVSAPADPQLLPRLIEPIAKLGAVPSRMHASRESGDGSELGVELRLSGVPARTARLVEFALRAVVGVHKVMAVVEAEG